MSMKMSIEEEDLPSISNVLTLMQITDLLEQVVLL